MDAFSSDELINIHNAFHQGQFKNVADFDTSAFSTSNKLHARILQYRARVELGEAGAVLSDIDKNDGEPDLAAVKLFAQYSTMPDGAITGRASALAKAHGDNATVQLLCGTVLANAGMKDEATALLAKHQGSLDAIALLAQIHLSQNRVDLATQEVRKARSWASDSLLVNLAESWVGLREGGEKYQSAFYVYEELATAPSTSSTRALLGQAIAELHLGRLPEAEAALDQALSSTKDANVVANAIVLSIILGKEHNGLLETLQALDSKHLLIDDLEKKREAFAAAKAKYQPRFEIQG